MSFFQTVLSKLNLPKHDGRAIWNYNLSDSEFAQLRAHLSSIQLDYLDAKDAALYFAEWWKRNYCGGSPSKQEVFKSLGRIETYAFNADSFYEKGKRGAQMFGVKWIQKQNTLYFRTLLLQGGIPIKHISENRNHYQAFLLAILETQPNTVEDIILNQELANLLPASCRNETIYENCLAIVKSVLNDEETYTHLFSANESLKQIASALQIRRLQLSKAPRVFRPKIFWVMHTKDNKTQIELRIAFANKYTPEALSEILRLKSPTEERTYRLYLDETLVCTFRKMLSGDYRTEWEMQFYHRWGPSMLSPQFYCVCNEEKWEINDLIPVFPSTESPTLWAPFGDEGWRLVKGNTTNSSRAVLVLPEDWRIGNEQLEKRNIAGYVFKIKEFEGEISVRNAELEHRYISNVDSFDWNFRSDKPKWLRKSDLSVVTRNLVLDLYDSEGIFVNPNTYKTYFKSTELSRSWQILDRQTVLPIGLIDIKIERNGVIAYDTVYNIGDIQLEVSSSSLNSATLNWIDNSAYVIKLVETEKFSVNRDNNKYHLHLNTTKLSIPDAIQFSIKFGQQKALHCDIQSPFSGLGLLNKEGILLEEETILTLNDIQGIRILTSNAGETNIKLWNKLRDQVKISKTIHINIQPLIGFKDELSRLFYLADAMRHDNLVVLEFSSGNSKKKYYVRGFSHLINDVSSQLERKIKIDHIQANMQVYAVPLNFKPEEIELIEMLPGDDAFYHLPNDTPNGQFILVSNISNGQQLQPRFINTDATYEGKSSSERIKNYHTSLLNANISDAPWKELLTYYKICITQQIPFSTFDQIRAIARSSELAAKAFFSLGINQEDIDDFIQRQIPALEQDLGFNFHWITKHDWERALGCAENWIGSEYFNHLLTLMAKYFQETNLDALYKFIGGHKIENGIRVNNQVIGATRAQLCDRVLNELPRFSPHTTSDYNIPVEANDIVKLLLRAPTAIAESIKGVSEKSIWADDKAVSDLRRNIQYAHFIAPDLYTKVLYHCLSFLN